ncbi:hypothetical protein [Halobacteriovorax sp. HLS]|uniref:hypothetical protein n=1 Tax=Halobacteriovorax sp. HLS TaxID=2234000 RepID=UPI000FDCA32D|nr:hypothetical protein [Halobacteriovorax sp. HLS]
MFKFLRRIFLCIILILAIISTSIQFGAVNLFLTPYLKEIFSKYVPELHISSISYNLFDFSSFTVRNVQYKRESLFLEASEVYVTVDSLTELIKSLSSNTEIIYKELFLNLDVEISNFEFNKKGLGNIRFQLLKERGEKLYFNNFVIEKMNHSLDLNFYVDTLNDRLLLDSNKVDLLSILKLIDEKYSISALVDVHVDLDWTNEFRGKVRLFSDDFYLKGIQVDKIMDTFSRPAKTEFLDVATIVALGPMGLLTTSATKMGGDLILYSGGETYLSQLAIDLVINQSVLTFEDVAFATKKNRAALIGKINLDTLSLVETTFYILDTNDCALISQDIKGTILAPKVQPTVTLINSLISPLVSFAKKASPLSCKKVYSGKVKPPQKNSRGKFLFLKTE